MKIIHITTVHPRTDIRIFVKQARTLAECERYEVSLYVQDGMGEDKRGTVPICDTGVRARGRVSRATRGAWRMFHAVRAARPAVVHFHDPELIPIGLALKLLGIKVVYDLHEDLPRQILRKYWIPAAVRRSVAWGASVAEWVAARSLDALVTATPKIAERFPPDKAVVVQNFPVLDELVVPVRQPYATRPRTFAYVGGITRERGVMEMLAALDMLSASDAANLELAGLFMPAGLETEARVTPGWARVRFHGWIERSTVARLLGDCRAGVVLFHPSPNHVDAQPNKMFEYMAASLPVIASDFPFWRKTIGELGCGLLVDPLDPRAIAEAMQWILDHPAEAEAMGQRGRDAVVEKYNWESESKKLIALYGRLLPDERAAA